MVIETTKQPATSYARQDHGDKVDHGASKDSGNPASRRRNNSFQSTDHNNCALFLLLGSNFSNKESATNTLRFLQRDSSRAPPRKAERRRINGERAVPQSRLDSIFIKVAVDQKDLPEPLNCRNLRVWKAL